MHMIRRKVPNSAELETARISRSPTTVVTAKGEVQTNEEVTGYVKELDLFLTMKVLEDTPAVLSLKKFCEEDGYSDEWTSGHKPHIINHGIRMQCDAENYVPITVPGYHQLLHHQARLLLHLQHHQRRILKVPYQIQCQLEVRVRIDLLGETRCMDQAKSLHSMKIWITN